MSGFGFSSWKDDLNFDKPAKPERKVKSKPEEPKRSKESDGKIPKQIVMPLTQGQFPPFTHFFISIRCAQNLANCEDQSLFLRIRVHPSIPVVETPSVWCAKREVNFDASYAFDFTQLPPFNLTDFTPVVEIYKKSVKKPELFSILLLPLRVCEIVDCCGESLTFLYRESSRVLKGLASGEKVGSVIVTVAMGFPIHKKLYASPRSEIVSAQKFAPSVVTRPINEPLPSPVKPKPGLKQPSRQTATEKRRHEQHKHCEQCEPSDDEEERPRRKKHSALKQKKADDYSWVNEAIRLGWKPPGSTDFDWKGKARERGWKPPSDQIHSSIGVTCDPNVRGLRRAADIQTEPLKPPEYSEKQLMRMLHEKRRKKKKSLQIQSSGAFEMPFKTPRLGVEPCLTLISEAPTQTAVIDDDESSSEQHDIHGEVQDLLSLTSRNLKSFRISSDENSDYEEEDESDCGFFKRQESDGTGFMRKLAINDPQLMKMMELM